jgi:hypothetical protein
MSGVAVSRTVDSAVHRRLMWRMPRSTSMGVQTLRTRLERANDEMIRTWLRKEKPTNTVDERKRCGLTQLPNPQGHSHYVSCLIALTWIKTNFVDNNEYVLPAGGTIGTYLMFCSTTGGSSLRTTMNFNKTLRLTRVSRATP